MRLPDIILQTPKDLSSSSDLKCAGREAFSFFEVLWMPSGGQIDQPKNRYYTGGKHDINFIGESIQFVFNFTKVHTFPSCSPHIWQSVETGRSPKQRSFLYNHHVMIRWNRMMGGKAVAKASVFQFDILFYFPSIPPGMEICSIGINLWWYVNVLLGTRIWTMLIHFNNVC